MNLTSPSQVRRLAAELGVSPSRTLGQNFLVDRNILDILVAEALLTPADRVLEVGPGLGVVTERLLAEAGSVVAVEKDHRLADHLARRWEHDPALELICADALSVDLGSLGCGKVVSNLPYAVGSRVLVDLARLPQPPARLVVTVQQEVAERITAKPGGRDYGLMSVWLGLAYDARLVRLVKPTCFWPRPEVTSAIVSLVKHADERLNPAQASVYHSITKRAFGQRRKQLAKVLADAVLDKEALGRILTGLGVDARARAEALDVEAWCALAREMERQQRD